EGAYNATKIKLTPLATQIVRPLSEGQDVNGKRKPFLTPRVIRDFISRYDGNALPRQDIALNVLESLGVPHDRREDVCALILSGAKACGIVFELKGKDYVQLASRDE